jgi:predicted nucleic acid-binding protein
LSAYYDSAYIAKCYVNEPDSAKVRALLRASEGGHSSSLSRAEVAAVLVRHVREGSLDRKQGAKLHSDFVTDIDAGVWTMVPLSDVFMERVAARLSRVPVDTYVRAGDAVHLCAAKEAGFDEVWTNDRHMLGAAAAFGLRGRSA